MRPLSGIMSNEYNQPETDTHQIQMSAGSSDESFSTGETLTSNPEYAVIGHSRATVGRFLGVGDGLASSGIALLIASAITYAERWDAK